METSVEGRNVLAAARDHRAPASFRERLDTCRAETLEAGVAEVVDGLRTEPVTEAELTRAKALLTTSWWRQMSTVAGRADTLSRYTVQFGDPATAAYRLPGWLAVTADDITEVATRTLQPSSRVTLTYLPESDGAEQPA